MEKTVLERVNRLLKWGVNLDLIEEFMKSGEKLMRVSREKTGHSSQKSLLAALHCSIKRSECKGRVKAVARNNETYLIRLD
ncbi:MAG: hypothetical protein IKM02_05470 [Clostridia bacterium]|nr:hypothetical protein [Clostridia bacterium]